MPKHDKRHRFLSESTSRSRSRSRSESSSPSRSRSESRKKHKKYNEDKKRDRKYYKRDRKRSESRERSRSREERRRKDKDRRSKDRSHRDRNDRRNRRSEDDEGRYPSPPREEKKDDEPKVSPEKPCFIPSGILAKYSNTVNGVVLKFTEPLDAKVPNEVWRIFPFKGDQALDVIHLAKKSVFLFGKEPRVCDILLENPTCSSQHAVIQFREVRKTDELGRSYSVVKPYLMDLDSTNGTYLNGERIEPARYYELLHKDVIKFAHSSRDYVVMKEDE